jgi:mRNA interferase MazF
VISERWDVVVVPFPFTERPASKRRPALTLSTREFNAHGHSVLAMITTKTAPPWPGDTTLTDLAATGLPAASTVRLKVFTLDNRLVAKIAGSLSASDRRRVAAELSRFIT